jgi:hypothetical protein
MDTFTTADSLYLSGRLSTRRTHATLEGGGTTGRGWKSRCSPHAVLERPVEVVLEVVGSRPSDDLTMP